MTPTRQILGIQFFNGSVDEAVALMFRDGGLLVAPSGTCFARFREDETYRRALLAADLVIADSGLMVVLWRFLQRENIQRISGLKYLKHLLGRLKGEGTVEVFWVLPSKRGRQKLLAWILSARKFVVSASDPLHRRGAWFHHRRSGCNSRLGGPVLSRLALAIGCAAAPFSSAPDPRI